MTFSFAIVDDSEADAAYGEGLVREWAAARGHEARIRTFSSAEGFLFSFAEDKSFDILLLDIEMGAMDGVTMAKRVRRVSETVQLVFITGYSEYIAEGYELAALHYLLKPVAQDKLFAVLDRAVKKIEQNGRRLNLTVSGEMVRIPLYEIRYLTVRQNYVTVHAGQEYTVKRPLAEFEQELDESFCRAGRGLILNLRCIARTTKTQVTLLDGTALPLPRGAYETLNRAIIAHI